AEPDTDTIEENQDGTYTVTSVEMNPDAYDSYRFTGSITDYSVTEGYAVTVSVDGTETTFEELTGENSGSSDGSDDSSDGKKLTLHASPDNPDTYCDVSFTVDGEVEYGDEAEPDTDTIEENQDGTYTVTSVRMNPDAYDSYHFSGTITDYSVTDGYDVTVSVDGTETTFEELTGENSGSSDDSDSSGDDSDGSGDDDAGGSDGSAQQQRTLIIDGTGDSEETAKYQFSVTGTLERDEQRTTVTDGGLPWDKVRDYVTDSRAVGLVGNGQDAYRFTGGLQSVEIDGEADVKILEG
ncbi:hypothetical protein ACFR9U_15630, partial [Halorientalis brevis]